MNEIDLNALRNRAYKTACEHGFHDTELSNEHLLMLVITELSEAVEADRSNSWNRCAKVDWFKKRIETSRICQGLDPEIPKERGYEVAYDECIKGSIDEELADAVIRLLDLAGLRSISIEPINEDIIEEMEESCKDETFTESIYSISTLPARYEGVYDIHVTLNGMITAIFGLAKHLEIDLLWHIEQKMKYNEFREKMHGKKY